MSDFDYVKVGKPDEPDPFSMEQLFSLMKELDLEKDAPFIGVLYGDPGSRKTVRSLKLAQSLIKVGQKILYLYSGQGFTSFKNHPELQFGKDGKKNIVAMPYIRYEQVETLRKVLMNKTLRERLNFGAVIFDEYNRMQDMDTDVLTRHRAGMLNSGPKQFDKKTGVQIYKDPNTPEWPEYNTTKLRLISLLNDCFMVPETHFIFVCHSRFQKANARNEPDFPDKTAAALISLVHSIYHCGKEDTPNGTTYPIRLEGTAQTIAKNRIGGMPAVIYDTEAITEAYKKWGQLPDGFQPVIETGVAKETEVPAEKVQEPEVVEQVVEGEVVHHIVEPVVPTPVVDTTEVDFMSLLSQ